VFGMTSRKRDNAYYLDQLRKRSPDIHRRYLAGEFKSGAAAFRAAGLRKSPSTLNALRRAWRNASLADQTAFAAEVSLLSRSVPSAAPAITTPTTVCGPDQRLTPDGVLRIQDIMAARGLGSGDVMAEMGFKRLDASLGMAIRRTTRIQPALAKALQSWSDRH
jgi:hypothetical protein